MKTKTILLIVVAIQFCSYQNIFAQNTHEKQDTIVIQDSTKTIFTCPMHLEVISDKPGICPKCSMELVKMEKEKTPQKHQMDMMMCPMHGMVDMNHKHNEQKKDNMKMMKGMGIAMGVMMVVMIVIIGTR